MLLPRFRAACTLLLVAAVGWNVALSASGQTAAARVGTTLNELEQWLNQGPGADQWRALLQLDQLRQQLNNGQTADPAVVAAVLGRFGSGAEGLDLPPFVRARQAMAQWLAELPNPSIEQLAAATRSAKSVFLPRTPTDLYEARRELTEAVNRLDARLNEAGPGAAAWRAFLNWDSLVPQLNQPTPDLAALDAIYAHFAAGYDGLGLVWFADVRQTLRRYLATARAIGDPKLRQQYETLLDSLATQLEAYQRDPSPDRAAAISLSLGWLTDAGQTPWLVAVIQRRLSHPNIYADVSSRLVNSRLSRTVDDTQAVEDCILGTTIYATAHAVGRVFGTLEPCEKMGLIDAIAQAQVSSQAVGYNGPATIQSVNSQAVGARKRIYINAEGIGALPAASQVTTNTTIYSIDTGGRQFIERIAWRRAAKQKPEAEAIGSEHASQRFNERMDKESEPMVVQANDGFQKRFRRPLSERKLFPESLVFSTTSDAVHVTMMTLGGMGIGAPTAPPDAGAADVTLRTHESSINNLTATALSGAILDEKRLDEIVTKFFGLPERVGTATDEENWGITFARQQPVTVQFTDGGFSITLRGSRYMNQGRDYPGMNVTAVYKIQPAPQGFRAVRQGPLAIFPPGFVPDSGRTLSARQQVLRSALQKRLVRFFEDEIVPKNLVLAKNTPQPIELRLIRWETRSGWMAMGWQQVPLSQPPAKTTADVALR